MWSHACALQELYTRKIPFPAVDIRNIYPIHCWMFSKSKSFSFEFQYFRIMLNRTGASHFPGIHAYILYLFCCCYMIIHHRFLPCVYTIHSEILNRYWSKRMIMIAQVLVYFKLTSKSIDIKSKQNLDKRILRTYFWGCPVNVKVQSGCSVWVAF